MFRRRLQPGRVPAPAPTIAAGIAAGLAACLLAPGCVAPHPAPAAPEPRPAAPVPVAAPPPPAPAPADWRDWPQTPGTWTYAADPRGSRATFGTPGAEPLVLLRCDRGARAIVLARRGTGATLTIRTSSTQRTLAVQPVEAAPGFSGITFAPSDPLLDAIAFSRGRFAIEGAIVGGGAARLALPAWAEIGRVIEDCRA